VPKRVYAEQGNTPWHTHLVESSMDRKRKLDT
jgi:hypothetical protein